MTTKSVPVNDYGLIKAHLNLPVHVDQRFGLLVDARGFILLDLDEIKVDSEAAANSIGLLLAESLNCLDDEAVPHAPT